MQARARTADRTRSIFLSIAFVFLIQGSGEGLNGPALAAPKAPVAPESNIASPIVPREPVAATPAFAAPNSPRAPQEATPVRTASLPAREHKLSIVGLTRDGKSLQLSSAQLASSGLALNSMVTNHKDESPAKFEGVTLDDFTRAYANPKARRLRVAANNAYEVTLSLDDPENLRALLAFRRDGASIPTAERGTFRIVMDLSKIAVLERELRYPRFVWSVTTAEFLP